MSMFGGQWSGSSNSIEEWLKAASSQTIFDALAKFGQEGVEALAAATPTRSGLTASSWSYEVLNERGSWSIIWKNSNVVDGVPVVVLIQHGHATGTGGYVEGIDFINPAIKPIFEKIVNEAWKAVNQ